MMVPQEEEKPMKHSQQQQNGADDSFEEGGGEKGLVFLRGTVVKNDQQGECMDVNAFVSDGETTFAKRRVV